MTFLKGQQEGEKQREKPINELVMVGLNKANDDFDGLNPSDVKDITTKYGAGRTQMAKGSP